MRCGNVFCSGRSVALVEVEDVRLDQAEAQSVDRPVECPFLGATWYLAYQLLVSVWSHMARN